MKTVVAEKDRPKPAKESPRSSKDISEMIENHMQTCFSWVFSSPHSRVEDRPEFLRLTSDVPHPMSNFVFRARFPSQEVGVKIDEMIGFFKSKNLPVTWLVGPSCKPADIGQHLVSHGLAWEVDVGGMTIDLSVMNEDLAVPEDLTIKRVESKVDMEQYLIPFGRGFEFPDIVVDGWRRMDSSHGFGKRLPRTNYVGLMNGAPVSCATLFKASDMAGVYCVATVPEMRRKGAATALIVNALREARDEGFEAGLLQAKAMGAGVYRKIGFVDRPCKISWYVWSPPAQSERS
jgi:GNAT superfamily N-acetyltransferase